MSWFRVNDFYQISSNRYNVNGLLHEVEYENSAYFCLIKKITVKYYDSYNTKQIVIELHFSKFHLNELEYAVNKFFVPYEHYDKEYDYYTGFPALGYVPHLPFTIDYSNKFSKLINFFKFIEKEYRSEESTSEIITELKLIFAFIFEPSKLQGKQPNHTISEYELSNKHINPILTESNTLINLCSKKKFSLIKLKTLLTQGEDPDQVNENGSERTPLSWAIHYNNIYLVKLLISYGANPFKRFGWLYVSAIELAKDRNKVTILNIIFTEFNGPKKSLNLQIMQSAIYNGNKQVITRLNFSNNASIYTFIKDLSKLNEFEIASMFGLFKQFFKSANGDSKKTEAIFYSECIPDKDKFSELIYNEKQELIGFRLFELLKLESKKNHLFWHCIYAVIKPEYRSYGIMSLLSFRPAFSLQLLAPDYTIGMYLSAIEKFSYRAIKDYLHGPKYQSKYILGLLGDILHEIYEDKIKLFQNGTMTFYATEPDPVLVKFNDKISNNIHDDFYYQDLLGYTESKINENDPRFSPILFLVDEDSFVRLAQSSAKIGISFSEHVKQFARSFKSLLPEVVGENLGKPFSGYTKSHHLFFLEKKIIPENKLLAKKEIYSYYSGKL